MTKAHSEKRALILVAHADDETLGAGGTIPKLIQRGWDVTVVILSDAMRFGGHGNSNRQHAMDACHLLGVKNPLFLDFPDQRFDTFAMADIASSVINLHLDPDLIITHVDHDLNRDHRLVCEVAKIVGRPLCKPVHILGCEIPSTSFYNGTVFQANFFVDITDSIDQKINAFNTYLNEVHDFPHPWSAQGLKLLAQYHGMQCGLPFAEAFQVIRLYGGLEL